VHYSEHLQLTPDDGFSLYEQDALTYARVVEDVIDQEPNVVADALTSATPDFYADLGMAVVQAVRGWGGDMTDADIGRIVRLEIEQFIVMTVDAYVDANFDDILNNLKDKAYGV
jgi:hypothetical protein